MTNRICYTCKVEKALEEFNKDASRKDGYRTTCRECDTARKKLEKDMRKELSRVNQVCDECGEELHSSQFRLRKASETGLDNICKHCRAVAKALKKREEEVKKKKREEYNEEFEQALAEAKEKFIQKNKDKLFYCKHCDKHKTIDDYYIRNASVRYVNGEIKCAKMCKECQNRYAVERHREEVRKRGF